MTSKKSLSRFRNIFEKALSDLRKINDRSHIDKNTDDLFFWSSLDGHAFFRTKALDELIDRLTQQLIDCAKSSSGQTGEQQAAELPPAESFLAEDAKEVVRITLSVALRMGKWQREAIDIWQEVNMRLQNSMRWHSVAVPFYGVCTKSGGFDIGPISFHSDLKNMLDDSGKHSQISLNKLNNLFGASMWMVHRNFGTRSAITRTASNVASQFAGYFSLICHVRNQYRLSQSITSGTKIHHMENFIMWEDESSEIGFQSPYGRFTGNIEITEEMIDWSRESRADHLFTAIIESRRNSMLDAISKALFWFGEASRDQKPIMALIKFWSCIEVFISHTKIGISERIYRYLPIFLTCGVFELDGDSDLQTIREKVRFLYDSRSYALHSAGHQQAHEDNASEVGLWAAYMILNMSHFFAEGCSSINDVDAIGDHLLRNCASQKH